MEGHRVVTAGHRHDPHHIGLGAVEGLEAVAVEVGDADIHRVVAVYIHHIHAADEVSVAPRSRHNVEAIPLVVPVGDETVVHGLLDAVVGRRPQLSLLLGGHVVETQGHRQAGAIDLDRKLTQCHLTPGVGAVDADLVRAGVHLGGEHRLGGQVVVCTQLVDVGVGVGDTRVGQVLGVVRASVGTEVGDEGCGGVGRGHSGVELGLHVGEQVVDGVVAVGEGHGHGGRRVGDESMSLVDAERGRVELDEHRVVVVVDGVEGVGYVGTDKGTEHILSHLAADGRLEGNGVLVDVSVPPVDGAAVDGVWVVDGEYHCCLMLSRHILIINPYPHPPPSGG